MNRSDQQFQQITQDLKDEIAVIRSRTAGYATDPEFRAQWFGLGRQSINYRTQQLRAFGNLLASVTSTLGGWRILDVGCGSGYWLRAFLEFDARPKDVVGIDVSDDRFALGRSKSPLITLLQTDGLTFPVKNDCFDLVTQFVVFSTMSAVLRSRVAAEVCRVLKPGGFIFWWDHYTMDTTNSDASLHPSDYFDWPVRELGVGELPRPSECVRLGEDLGRFLGGLDRLGYPVTHRAALIGPKP